MIFCESNQFNAYKIVEPVIDLDEPQIACEGCGTLIGYVRNMDQIKLSPTSNASSERAKLAQAVALAKRVDESFMQ